MLGFLTFTLVAIMSVGMASGVNPIVVGAVLTFCLLIGFCRPTMGENTFVVSNISIVPNKSMSHPILPLFVGMLLLFLLVTYVPALSLAPSFVR